MALGSAGCSSASGPGADGGSMGQEFPCTEQGIRDAIVEGGGPHTFACDGPTRLMTESEIVVDHDVTLDVASRLTVDGGGAHLVLSVAEGVDAELRGFTVTNGNGGIRNMGTLTVTHCTVSGNYRLGVGGGLYNAGTMMLVGTTVAENTAEDQGGGIFNSYGTLVVTNTTVSGTIYAEGGPGENVVAVVASVGTVVSGEPGSSPGCFGTPQDIGPNEWVSDGYNIEVGGDSCGFDTTGDQINVSAEALNLGPLADNGGPTMTHALGAGSVAIDWIPEADCVDADGQPVTTDQRGQPRPETDGTICDVGAFEVQA